MLNYLTRTKPEDPPDSSIPFDAQKPSASLMLSEQLFAKMLVMERKRTERSGRRFLLMLLDCGKDLGSAPGEHLLPKLQAVLTAVARDTDLKGWYRLRSVIGVIFTEIGSTDGKAVVHALSTRMTGALLDALSIQELNELKLSFHIFPEDWDGEGPAGPATSSLRVALGSELRRNTVDLALKRLMDITGSLLALLLFLPLLAVIALAIKLTSEGPVLYRQVRLGQFGRKFTFLKFRTMYIHSDQAIHEEYIHRFISGASSTDQLVAGRQRLYKLTADPRITPLGRFLRRTSLDELPQFFHVLAGEMSLVGPRPPVVYEYQRYHLWHKQRLLAVKPGITGLWQVYGRSRVKFDDMVRLDIRYARTRSLWLDIKILMLTPRAVLSGEGAC